MGEIVLEIQNRYLENQTTAEKNTFFFYFNAKYFN